MRRELDFAVEDGVRLSAVLHAPDGGGPAPLLVMSDGFSGVKGRIEHYANAFASDGFCVLLHDHRGFGASGGALRLEVDAAVQMADWRDAITFGLQQPEVDAEAPVGIWGTSFAGGMAIVIGAVDPRVGCVVAQVPHVSGPRNTPWMYDPATRAALDAAFVKDRRGRLEGAPPATAPVFTSDPDEFCVMPPAVSPGYLAEVEARAPGWSNTVTLRSVENAIHFEPAAYLPYLSPKPFLMIVGRNDTVTFAKVQLEAFAQAREPKKLVVHPGGHFDTYIEHFPQTSGAARDWFRRHLGKATPHADPEATGGTGGADASQ